MTKPARFTKHEIDQAIASAKRYGADQVVFANGQIVVNFTKDTTNNAEWSPPDDESESGPRPLRSAT